MTLKKTVWAVLTAMALAATTAVPIAALAEDEEAYVPEVEYKDEPIAVEVDSDNGIMTLSEETTTVAEIDGTSYESVSAAINAVEDSATITLTADVSEGYITVPGSKTIVLDLGGNTLTLTGGTTYTDTGGTDYTFRVSLVNQGTLTIQNGTIKGNGTYTTDNTNYYYVSNTIINTGTLNVADNTEINAILYDIMNIGGTVNTAGDITTTYYDAILTYGGEINVTDGTLTATSSSYYGCGITIFGRYYDTTRGEDAAANVTISGGTINAYCYGCSTNNLYSGDSSLTITGGTIETVIACIYWPTPGTITIGTEGSTSNDTPYLLNTGGSGIVICCGTLNVYSGTIEATYAATSSTPFNSTYWAEQYRANSGMVGLADAISVIANRSSAYSQYSLVINLAGGVYTSASNYTVRYANCNAASDSDTDTAQSISVTLSGGTYTGGTQTDGTAVAAVDASCEEEDAEDTLEITGGTYSSDVSDYISVNYYYITDGNGTVTVYESNAKVRESADSSTYSVTVNGLWDFLTSQDDFDYTENAEYKVVLADIDDDYSDVVAGIKDGTAATPAPSEDETEAASLSEEEEATATEAPTYFEKDLSVKKYVNSVEDTTFDIDDMLDGTSFEVKVDLPVAAAESTDVTFYHITDSDSTATDCYETPDVTLSEDRASFTVNLSSFSPTVTEYTPTTLTADDYASNVYLALVEQSSGVYNLKLYGADDLYIYRFSAAQLKFAFDDSCDIYNIGALDITPTDSINISYQGDGEYVFYVDATQYTDCITAKSITLGTVTISGVGSYSLGLDESYENQAHGAESANSIVYDFVYDADGTVSGSGYLLLDSTIPATDTVNLATSDMTVNVMFLNTVEEASTAYTAMTVTYSNFLKTADVALGDDNGDVTITYDTIDADANPDDEWIGYSFTVSVPQNYTTTLTFEGDGYRTYRTTIIPTSPTSSVTVWNNAMDGSTAVISADDADSSVAETITFLAGDIVNQGIIDLYDLSAVVSYFGKSDLDTESVSTYAQYDLNRDGKIDSKDIAMALVSWGK